MVLIHAGFAKYSNKVFPIEKKHKICLPKIKIETKKRNVKNKNLNF